MSDTPLSYAKSIAYIGDASTIRVRTLGMFGRAPSLKVCLGIVAEREAKARQAVHYAQRRSANRGANGGTRMGGEAA